MRMLSMRFRITVLTIIAILTAILSIFGVCFSSLEEEKNRSSVEMMLLIGRGTRDTLDKYFVNIEQSVSFAANMAMDSLDSLTLVECGAAGSHAGETQRSPEQEERLDAYLTEHCRQIQRTFMSLASHTGGAEAYYYCISPAVSKEVHGFYYSRVGKAGFVEQESRDGSELDFQEDGPNSWYFTAIERGRPSWIGPYEEGFGSERLLCSYVMPVYSAGTLIGLLGMDIAVKTLEEQVRPIRIYDTGYASLCDKEGHVFYHPTVPRGMTPQLEQLSVPRITFDKEDSGDEQIRYLIQGKEHQLSFFALRNGMRLVMTAPVEEINEHWMDLAHQAILITAVIILAFAGIIMLVMYFMLRPLRMLTDASKRLASGDYEVALPYRGNDEVGFLTTAFEGMRTEIKRYIGDLNRRIDTDALTGLPNMRFFFKLAKKERERLEAEGKEPVMLFFDLIGMKHFNRQYGFSAGDQLLCEIGQILKEQYGAEHICRYSDDHFAAVTQEEGVKEGLKELFVKCKGACGGNSLPMRVGIYYNRVEPVGASIACDRAKYACDKYRSSYVSGYYEFSQAMIQELDDVRYIINHIEEALSNHWIEVYYQPIIRGVNGQVCDEEALSRWIDPVKGMLSPGMFIPILEKGRLIYKLDLYVLDEIIKRMKAQREAGLHLVPISLNLSRADFDACDIVEEICTRLDGAGIPRDRLTIEITESILGRDFAFMKQQVERFQSLGFSVWMDDFGSGYSSLDVLQDIRFDLIKFDMRFMHRFEQGDESKIMLRELVIMANNLGLDTLCEGVETREQVEFLREIGCSKLQGFYFCKPIHFKEILRRYEEKIQIGFEDPKESSYYACIDRVSLYDLTSVFNKEEGSANTYDNSLPVCVLEVGKGKARFVRFNKAYRHFMLLNFGIDLSEDTSSLSWLPNDMEDSFMKRVWQCCTGGELLFYDGTVDGGKQAHVIMNRVGVSSSGDKAAVAVAVLSVKEAGESASYADIARALAADYYNIYVVDLDTENYIKYSSPVGEEDLAMERHGTRFFESIQDEARMHIFEMDRDDFLEVFTREKILKELREHGTFQTTYRLIDTGEPVYVNMKVSFMPGKSRMIAGISVMDSRIS